MPRVRSCDYLHLKRRCLSSIDLLSGVTHEGLIEMHQVSSAALFASRGGDILTHLLDTGHQIEMNNISCCVIVCMSSVSYRSSVGLSVNFSALSNGEDLDIAKLLGTFSALFLADSVQILSALQK